MKDADWTGSRRWTVGMVGTFDVENYGDLLFPLIAKHELRSRLGDVDIIPFSYFAKTSDSWPFTVRSLTDLVEMLPQLDALLIGGGYLIRFDAEVAPGYGPPSADIHHPTGYWLMPALAAIEHGIPVLRNAPGMNDNEIPQWAAPLMEIALRRSDYVAVRDPSTREALLRFGRADIEVVPDTASGLSTHPRVASIEADRPWTAAGLRLPYIAVQASISSRPFVDWVTSRPDEFKGYQFLAIRISPALGDRDAAVAALPNLVTLDAWPHPFVIASLIRNAALCVGISFHGAITALTAGVPVGRPEPVGGGRFGGLARIGDLFGLFDQGVPDATALGERISKPAENGALRSVEARLCAHWDRVASTIADGRRIPRSTSSWIGRVPFLLQPASTTASPRPDVVGHATATPDEAGRDAPRDPVVLDDLADQLSKRTVELEARDRLIADIYRTKSWIYSTPLRRMRAAQLAWSHHRTIGGGAMRFAALARTPLRETPYRFVLVEGLVPRRALRELSRTYPLDNFKLVEDFAGEKDYSYEARELIPMHGSSVAHPTALSSSWKRLGRELLSAEYRQAMSDLIGIDLSSAQLEVNVFHYGADSLLGPHTDLEDKIVTHVMYFNPTWDESDGGYLRILNSADPEDVAMTVSPVLGRSVIIVRSDRSWHAVDQVGPSSTTTRRSLTATFYSPGSLSTMWPNTNSGSPVSG